MSPAEKMLAAAQELRDRDPLVVYDPRHANYDVSYRVYRDGAKPWSWGANVVGALSWLFRPPIGVFRGRFSMTRLRMAHYMLTTDHADSAPEVALDDGNVLIHWSEVAPFIQVWTPEMGEAVALFLEGQAQDFLLDGWEVDECPCHPCKSAERIADLILEAKEEG